MPSTMLSTVTEKIASLCWPGKKHDLEKSNRTTKQTGKRVSLRSAGHYKWYCFPLNEVENFFQRELHLS